MVVACGFWGLYYHIHSGLSGSTCAISIARDPDKHELTKHIGVDSFYTRAQVQPQVVALQYVPSDL
uniref:Uncharacterized protein n=1 Tax=Avena sativa TaxID=4498 RepID=A0ACD5X9F8_AVESA